MAFAVFETPRHCGVCPEVPPAPEPDKAAEVMRVCPLTLPLEALTRIDPYTGQTARLPGVEIATYDANGVRRTEILCQKTLVGVFETPLTQIQQYILAPMPVAYE